MKLLIVLAVLLAHLVPSLAEEVTCQCDNIGVAGAGNNGYTCTDGSSSAFCSIDQVCCSFETVDVSNKADLCCDNCTATATCSCASPNECSPDNGFVCKDSNVTTTHCSPPQPFCALQEACTFTDSSISVSDTAQLCQFKDECMTPAPSLKPSISPTLAPTLAPTPEPTPSPTLRPVAIPPIPPCQDKIIGIYSCCLMEHPKSTCGVGAILSPIILNNSTRRRARNLHREGPHGTATLVLTDSPTKFWLTVSVEDVEEECSNCKLYISESPDCSQGVIRSHPAVYNNDIFMDDPWEEIKYSVTNKTINYEEQFDHGVDFTQYEGKTMVLDDGTGRPAICGIFMFLVNDTSPTEAPKTSGATPLWNSVMTIGLFVAMATFVILMNW